MKRKMIIGTLLLVGFSAVSAVAQFSAADRSAVDSFTSAVMKAQKGKAAGNVEAAFEAITPLRDALTREVADGGTLLESLPDADCQRLEKELKGVLINREEIIFVRPDNDFWIKLAATKGDDADRAFFNAFNKTYPDDVWPVYIKQQTDVTGCTSFGSLELVRTYGYWLEFRDSFPGRYTSGAREEIDAVTDEIATSTCSCGDLKGVKREMEEFLKHYPESPVTKQLKVRLDEIQAGKTEIRERCSSG